VAFTEPNPNDDFDPDAERFHQQAVAIGTKMAELEEKASSELGLYAQRQGSIQQIPGTNDWAVQMTFQIGDRAYRKLQEDNLDTDRVFEHLEIDMIKDEILNELLEGDDEDE
jgi:hypothetical protein